LFTFWAGEKMSEVQIHQSDPGEAAVHLPAPTAWPVMLAFGATLGAAGLVTNIVVSIVGAVFVLAACVGWFGQVLPHEAHVSVPALEGEVVCSTSRKHIQHMDVNAMHRSYLPVETYPVKAGIKGGIAGGIAMIIPAILYGYLAEHSIWYPVNLLGGAGVAHWRNPSVAEIATFHWQGLIVATIIHILASLLVGLLYGAMLPMLPRRPVLLGGIVAPVLWTGLLHSAMGIINPVLDAHIAWGWFVASQIFFGVVAGSVVARAERIQTVASLPLVARLGIEAPGLMHSHDEEKKP
jgi:hypothetical protein